MSDPASPRRLPGPKTLLRSGALLPPGGVNAAEGIAAGTRDRGAPIRRALVDEIRAQAAAAPGRGKRRR